MELKELFEMQKKLDEHIIKEKGLEGQNLLPRKMLALQVELGELANEWRGFKFWSNNQEPRTEEFYEIIELCKCAENYDPICTDCMNTREIIHPAAKNPLLEEYVDCLHFILSIGNDLDVDVKELELGQDFTCETTVETFIGLNHDTGSLYGRIKNDLHDELDYQAVFWGFIGLGKKFLSFTWEQIVQAYKDKNQVNHTRQENGY